MHKVFCLSLCPWLLTTSDSAGLNETDVTGLVVMQPCLMLLLLIADYFFSRLVHPVNLSHLWLLESLWDTRANRGSRTATVTLLVLKQSGMSACWKHPPPDGSLTSAGGNHRILLIYSCRNHKHKYNCEELWLYLDFRMNGYWYYSIFNHCLL